MLARLAPGVNRAQAQAELDTIARDLARFDPALWRDVRFELLESDLVRGASADPPLRLRQCWQRCPRSCSSSSVPT